MIVLGSSWGPPQPGPENGLEWLPGNLFRDCFRLFLGSPQPGPENNSEWLPGSLFRDCFGLFLGSPPSQALKMARNGFLGAFFVTALGSSWGPPSQALKMAQNGSLGAFFVIVLVFSWGPPQPGPENGSEWVPRSNFRDGFGFFLGSQTQK